MLHEESAQALQSVADLSRDLRHGLRGWRRSPGFTAVAILTIALGIGATTAVFSIVEAVLLRPLPYRDVDRLVAIWDGHLKSKGLSKVFASYDDFELWRRNSTTIEQIAAATWATGDQILTGLGPARVVLAIPVSVDFFSVLGAAPMYGRAFDTSDLTRGCSVVLGHRFWQSTLAASPTAVGQTLVLDARECSVVGVMPERFAFYPEQTDMWTLITPNREQLPKPYAGVGVFARLKPGITLDRAQAEVAALHKQPHGNDNHAATFGPTVYPLQEEFTWLAGRNLRLTLIVLFAAVGFVLLIACLNVANLLLGRSLIRNREFAIRAALGGGRSRVVRQVLTEGLLLSCAGALLGILLAFAAVGSLRASGPVQLPPGSVLRVDLPVLVFAVVLAVSTAVCFGLVPAWRASRADISDVLRSAGRGPAGNVGGGHAARLLVVVEMACAMVLLVGAGLLARSIVRLGATPLGFNPDGLLTMRIKLPKTTYPAAADRARLFDRLTTELSSVPSVQGAALSTSLLRGHANNLLAVEGRPRPTLETAVPDVDQDSVSPDYFRVMEIPIRAGRPLASSDTSDGLAVAVVNQALVDKYFPDEDPIGRRIKLGTATSASWLTIVGVCGNQKSMSVYQEMSWVESPLVFQPVSQSAPFEVTGLVRVPSAPGAVGSTIQRRIAAVNADIPVVEIQSMRQRVSRDLAYPQFRAIVLGVFAGLALLLAIVGLYAVLSQLVAQRTQEFGVRTALGAGAWDIVRLVAIQGGTATLVGLAIGVVVAVQLAHVLVSLLYGVGTMDPVTITGTGLVLFAMATAAMLVPAWRAARVDPLLALRSE